MADHVSYFAGYLGLYNFLPINMADYIRFKNDPYTLLAIAVFVRLRLKQGCYRYGLFEIHILGCGYGFRKLRIN